MTVRFPGLNKAVHGGRGAAREEYRNREALDFSASLNPLPPQLTRGVSLDSIREYPDDQYISLKEVIARHHGRSPDEISVGNGSVEVIRTLCHTVLKHGSVAEIPPHTFSEYALSARLAGAEISEKTGAQIDLSFMCNPDNPSGILTRREQVIEYLTDVKTRGGILCVDEAFIDLADPAQSVSDIRDPDLFVLCSLTKSFSMAGVRFGYGIGDPGLIAAMEVMRPPWTVNVFAETMAMQAFEKFPDLERSRRYITDERSRICREAIRLGLTPSEASANYVLLETGEDVAGLTAAMFNHGILVRDCTSFGLPTCIRVAVREREENDRLLEALTFCLR
ncbi:histidinol-phosphate transaminase [uncultured Methanospirillum sp.]|uniref:pyridoxal phosphate-dependent aminotransferase n=1 Tax=uncultured Methanospirillum sp. TaxID=262503 RepID=UPI0029C8ED42|nr:histidinol-phosphate transaminase [uncultured Methanospirillum sp.]